MARKRATMREGPLAELFRKTEAAQRAQDEASRAETAAAPPSEPAPDDRAQAALEETVEHVHDFVEEPERAEPPVSQRACRAAEDSHRPRRPRRGPRLATSRRCSSRRRGCTACRRRRALRTSRRSASSASAAPA